MVKAAPSRAGIDWLRSLNIEVIDCDSQSASLSQQLHPRIPPSGAKTFFHGKACFPAFLMPIFCCSMNRGANTNPFSLLACAVKANLQFLASIWF
jgi:hypothetical protein